MKYSMVKVSSEEQPIVVSITSDEKPNISELMVNKWQDIIDLLALTINVPSSLIMRIEEKHISVFLASNTKDNPFSKGEKIELLSGVYCENVIGYKSCLLIPNALKHPLWKENFAIKTDMISYLGVPILWPDGEVFGTICIFDNKENYYNNQYIKLVELFRDSIEKDLKLALEEEMLKIELENRKIAEQKLRESENRYRELFNNMRSAVAIYNVKDNGEEFVFEEVNKAMELIENINKADLVGKTLEECFPTILHTDLLKIMKQVWGTGYSQCLGEIFYEDNRINGWRDNYYIYKLSSEQIVVIYDDVTKKIEYQKAINENERLICEARELEKLRTEFFANVSHELRTPLNIMLATTQVNTMMIQDEEKLIHKKKIMDNINVEKQNCFRLLRLINNIIDLTKIGSSNLELNMVNCDIVSLVEEISQSVAEHIHNIDLTLIFDTDVEEKMIACDLDKIERVIFNLLSNSIKFTEDGGSIFVNILDGEEYITITVEDTGIGIPEDKLNVVFDRFRQIDKSFTRINEGIGVGLSLVKSFIEMHDGTIYVESKYGVGTKFTIRIPVRVLEYNESKLKDNLVDKIPPNCVERINVEFSDIYKLAKK